MLESNDFPFWFHADKGNKKRLNKRAPIIASEARSNPEKKEMSTILIIND
jgi:hypothetical protein